MSLLTVWLHGQVVGELEQLRNARLRLRFTEDALSTYGFGARPLSLSLPLTDKRVQGDALERFCDNLLPEGTARAALEREHAIRPGDGFALLAHIGRECAGAIQFTTGDVTVADGSLSPLTDEQVDEIVRDLPTHPTRDGLEVSASLGGVQDKVLLTRTAEGWAWPSAGAMSTHLIKPEPISTQVVVPQIIRYEHWALRLAADAGLRAAKPTCRRSGPGGTRRGEVRPSRRSPYPPGGLHAGTRARRPGTSTRRAPVNAGWQAWRLSRHPRRSTVSRSSPTCSPR